MSNLRINQKFDFWLFIETFQNNHFEMSRKTNLSPNAIFLKKSHAIQRLKNLPMHFVKLKRRTCYVPHCHLIYLKLLYADFWSWCTLFWDTRLQSKNGSISQILGIQPWNNFGLKLIMKLQVIFHSINTNQAYWLRASSITDVDSIK